MARKVQLVNKFAAVVKKVACLERKKYNDWTQCSV